MKKIKIIPLCFHLCIFSALYSQNVGIGVTVPAEKLDVNGKVKSTGLVISNGGNQYDFLVKSTSAGQVGFKKAHGGLALNYIICISGTFPLQNGPVQTGPLLGEIRIFAGNFAPAGWVFCQGQLMSIGQNTDLFAILGTLYGGNGVTSFALPDLRGTTAIGDGTALPAGYQWTLGERVN